MVPVTTHDRIAQDQKPRPARKGANKNAALHPVVSNLFAALFEFIKTFRWLELSADHASAARRAAICATRIGIVAIWRSAVARYPVQARILLVNLWPPSSSSVDRWHNQRHH
jgi:hypothetical protein